MLSPQITLMPLFFAMILRFRHDAERYYAAATPHAFAIAITPCRRQPLSPCRFSALHDARFAAIAPLMLLPRAIFSSPLLIFLLRRHYFHFQLTPSTYLAITLT